MFSAFGLVFQFLSPYVTTHAPAIAPTYRYNRLSKFDVVFTLQQQQRTILLSLSKTYLRPSQTQHINWFIVQFSLVSQTPLPTHLALVSTVFHESFHIHSSLLKQHTNIAVNICKTYLPSTHTRYVFCIWPRFPISVALRHTQCTEC